MAYVRRSQLTAAPFDHIIPHAAGLVKRYRGKSLTDFRASDPSARPRGKVIACKINRRSGSPPLHNRLRREGSPLRAYKMSVLRNSRAKGNCGRPRGLRLHVRGLAAARDLRKTGILYNFAARADGRRGQRLTAATHAATARLLSFDLPIIIPRRVGFVKAFSTDGQKTRTNRYP